MESLGLTLEMAVVLGLLAFTVGLFVSEIVRVDVAAVLVMVLLGVLSAFPGLGGLADPLHLFDGFASNAVISIIAVMIIGAGLDRTGIMSRVAALILRYGGSTEHRLIPIVSGTVGVISSFMQNVGAAALFLPVVSRLSLHTEIPLSRLLMPMGFCAILGGTMTMVGSSPLILLNDLILTTNKTLPADARMEPFGMFDVTPVGVALIITGILYFVIAGRFVLPTNQSDDKPTGSSVSDYFSRIYGFDSRIYEVYVAPGSPITGTSVIELIERYNIYIVATHFEGRTRLEPPPEVLIEGPAKLAVMGSPVGVRLFVEQNDLRIRDELESFSDALAITKAGIAEVVIPPESNFIGQSASSLEIRKTYGLSLMAVFRSGECLSRIESEDHEATNIGIMEFQAGDTLVVHTTWEALARLEHNRNLVVVTSDYPHEEFRPNKVLPALIFFGIALGLVLFSDLRLSLCLLTGAAGMIITKVLSMDEAYSAVNWTTVFLLASLIPLGQAVQATGTAEWIARQIISGMGDVPVWGLQAAVAALATVFTLVMSNVGATVLLVPLAINIAIAADADPAIFALTVAVSTSNSFLIPTHQVNALIMGPAGYRVIDFVRSGSIMTILFLVVSLLVLNLL
ncbi:SLC13 family permease [Magnetospira sp. QH-2]|uniref:SLC13 family permease n=1 Tax=Magnetospira sp. (strain QH-2) TaxID=1288970 RepID=UPI0003E80EA4|nr:SLC13 family permease [Magnetospira sp. QH-2]CCQ72690.1 Putative citrate transporter [Magnetospira sp. QH-2]